MKIALRKPKAKLNMFHSDFLVLKPPIQNGKNIFLISITWHKYGFELICALIFWRCSGMEYGICLQFQLEWKLVWAAKRAQDLFHSCTCWENPPLPTSMIAPPVLKISQNSHEGIGPSIFMKAQHFLHYFAYTLIASTSPTYHSYTPYLHL